MQQGKLPSAQFVLNTLYKMVKTPFAFIFELFVSLTNFDSIITIIEKHSSFLTEKVLSSALQLTRGTKILELAYLGE